MSAEPFFVSFARNLEQGEGVQAFSDAVIRVGRAGTQGGKVVLTDRRLLVLLPASEPAEPGTFEVVAYERAHCFVISSQEHEDGSLMVAIDAQGAVVGLEFNSGWRGEGEQVVHRLKEPGIVRSRQVGAGFRLRAVG